MITKVPIICSSSPDSEDIHKSDKGSDILLTVKQVSEILKTNVDYVYKLKDSGLLPFIKIGKYKVLRTTLIEFLMKYQGKDITDPYEIKELCDVEDKRSGQE